MFSSTIPFQKQREKKLILLGDKKKPYLTGPTDPYFPICQIFFFQICQICKISHFLTKILKFQLKNVENKSEYFLKKFLQKEVRFLFENSVFLRSFLHKNFFFFFFLKSPPTDLTWEVRPPVRQLFFFVALLRLSTGDGLLCYLMKIFCMQSY